MENEQYDQKQQILNKYKSDLEFLENGRRLITESLQHSEKKDSNINKKLSKLDNSIEKLRTLIKDFEK